MEIDYLIGKSVFIVISRVGKRKKCILNLFYSYNKTKNQSKFEYGKLRNADTPLNTRLTVQHPTTKHILKWPSIHFKPHQSKNNIFKIFPVMSHLITSIPNTLSILFVIKYLHLQFTVIIGRGMRLNGSLAGRHRKIFYNHLKSNIIAVRNSLEVTRRSLLIFCIIPAVEYKYILSYIIYNEDFVSLNCDSRTYSYRTP